MLRTRADEELREFERAAKLLLQKCEGICEAAGAMSAVRASLREIPAVIKEQSSVYGLSGNLPPAETCETETLQLMGLLLMQAEEGVADANLLDNIRARVVKQAVTTA